MAGPLSARALPSTASTSAALPPRRARGLARRAAYRLIWLLWMVAWTEVVARAGFSLLDGESFDAERIAVARRAAIESTPLPDSFRGGGTTHRSGAYREVIHPYLGYALDLGSAAHREPFEVPTMRIEECSLGFPKREPGTLLVGLFGGSVATLFSEQGTARLAAALRTTAFARGREIRFVVGAAGGWKQPQQALALAWMASIGAELDVLINLDGFNEVALHGAENAKLGTFPAYPRRWAARTEKLPDAATRLALGRITVRGEQRITWAKAFEGAVARRSAAASLLWAARDAALRRDVDVDVAQLREKPTAVASFLTQGPDYDGDERGVAMADLVSIWEQSSRLIGDLCRAHRIRYFHFLQPNQYVEGSKPLSAEEREKCLQADHPYRPGIVAGHSLLVEAGRRLAADGESFHDLTAVFAEVHETLYIDTCCHFNRRGNELVADAMAAVLRRELDGR